MPYTIRCEASSARMKVELWPWCISESISGLILTATLILEPPFILLCCKKLPLTVCPKFKDPSGLVRGVPTDDLIPDSCI